jgi:hypothetical protein
VLLDEVLAAQVRVTLARSIGYSLDTQVLCISSRLPNGGDWAPLLFLPALIVSELDLANAETRNWLLIAVGAQMQARERAAASC